MTDSFNPDMRAYSGIALRRWFVTLYVLTLAAGVLAATALVMVVIVAWNALNTLQDRYVNGLSYSISSGFFVPTTLHGAPIRVDANSDVFGIAFGASGLLSVIVLLIGSYGLCMRSSDSDLLAILRQGSGQHNSSELKTRLKRCMNAVAFIGICVGASFTVAFPVSSVPPLAGICIGVAFGIASVFIARMSYRKVIQRTMGRP